jgi:hypothetical protein
VFKTPWSAGASDGNLPYGGNTAADDHVKIAVLTGSVAAALFATVVLRIRNRRYEVIRADEEYDDGIPEISVAAVLPVSQGWPSDPFCGVRAEQRAVVRPAPATPG